MLDLLLGLESRCPKVGCRVETDMPLQAAPPVLSNATLNSEKKKKWQEAGCRGRFHGTGRHAKNYKTRGRGQGQGKTSQPVFIAKVHNKRLRAKTLYTPELRTRVVSH